MEKHLSIKYKMFIFILITILTVAIGTSAIAFTTSANQINKFYQQNTSDHAHNFAVSLDGDYLEKLSKIAQSNEYQEIRNKAEEEDDESLVIEYLKDKDMFTEYDNIRHNLTGYINNFDEIKYLYIFAYTGISDSDMYLADDMESPAYSTGLYEEREEEFKGAEVLELSEPRISHGDWGWLCSDFSPVYNSKGDIVAFVGCDVGMDDVMAKRQELLFMLIGGTILLATLVLFAATHFINRTVVNPLHLITEKMKEFKPSEDLEYKSSGVIDIDLKDKDEINEIYQGIKTMQISVIDYLRNILNLKKDKEEVELVLENKEKEIDKLNVQTYEDVLTGVGNKTAYVEKTKEINKEISKNCNTEFAIVMVDMNNLKVINDTYGHKSGDQYIKGCCNIICNECGNETVYRIGGDEFVVVLTGKKYKNRHNIVKNLRNNFEESYNQKNMSPWLRYSAAVGIAEYAANDGSSEFVFNRADKNMYEDKLKIKEKHKDIIR